MTSPKAPVKLIDPWEDVSAHAPRKVYLIEVEWTSNGQRAFVTADRGAFFKTRAGAERKLVSYARGITRGRVITGYIEWDTFQFDREELELSSSD